MERRTADTLMADKAQRPDAQNDPRLDWFRAARFGAFIHWGLYALPDRWTDHPAKTEWHWTREWVQHVRKIPRADYAVLARDFNPRRFDADAWARVFAEAGQRYVVLTAKHHDGFCLYRSALTDFNVVDGTPFGRDIVGELADACRRHGLRFGVYYSQTQDWHHAGGHGNDWEPPTGHGDFDRYVAEFVQGQVTELLTNYGDIAIVWFDTPMIMRQEQSESLLRLVHRLQPDCLVCGRVGNGMGDYATTRDNQFLTARATSDWECPATMNDTWGFDPNDTNWKSVDRLLGDLRDCVATNGNYLLNVGPDGDGRIPEASIERLRAMGAALREHPEWLQTEPLPPGANTRA